MKLTDIRDDLALVAKSDSHRLWWINRILVTSPNGSHIHYRLSRRWRTMELIEQNKTPDGRLFLNEHGRDCDGVQYSGQIHMIDANYQALEDKYYELNQWADGPFGLEIISEQEAREAVYTSRDLVAEAFENGHPHTITTASL